MQTSDHTRYPPGQFGTATGPMAAPMVDDVLERRPRNPDRLLAAGKALITADRLRLPADRRLRDGALERAAWQSRPCGQRWSRTQSSGIGRARHPWRDVPHRGTGALPGPEPFHSVRVVADA
jgi:hypothetical protein